MHAPRIPAQQANNLAPISAGKSRVASVDASTDASDPETGYLRLGETRAPNGVRIDINNRYLIYNGKPWMPVMGEIHFARLPRTEWDEALARIKTSGVNIVASYIFWNFHEEKPGVFNWRGQRDLRAFVELVARHGLKFIARLGPWSHGELRYGGIPDWVVRSSPLRSNDPTYMRYLDRYWGQIGDQLKGLMWKEGGPIIGVQLENEYNLEGQEQGRDHIAALKKLAILHGFDVPLYTVTGWDGAIYPRREVLPVFGGYPDEPWGETRDKLPPKETYAFRFTNRVSGNLGALTEGRRGDSDADIPFTPFLGAEFGGGVPTMYRRRPIIRPDDIAAMLPVQLGSGVNLYGYYMYHGGSNPIEVGSLEENTAIGGYNDLPMIDYDFQAPFGAFGQANPVASYLRPFHYMLESYGDQIAPTTARAPQQLPSGNDDLHTLRWSVRAQGDHAFIFVNNHVRQYTMAAQPPTRFSVQLPHGPVTLPSQPVKIATGTYFIWPIGLDLGGQTLAWASAQPISRIETEDGPVHVFAASDDVPAEFAFAPDTHVEGAPTVEVDNWLLARVDKPGLASMLTVSSAGAPTVRIIVITQQQSRLLWRIDFAGQPHFLISTAQVVEGRHALTLTSLGDANFAFATWPALPTCTIGDITVTRAGSEGVFTHYAALALPQTPQACVRQVRVPRRAVPTEIGGLARAAVPPLPETFGNVAGAWEITIPQDALTGLDDAFLEIEWSGDIGRLFAGDTLIEDHFFDGRNWMIGLRRHADKLGKTMMLRITPLHDDAPIYLDEKLRPRLTLGCQIAEVRHVNIIPRYRLVLSLPPAQQDADQTR